MVSSSLFLIFLLSQFGPKIPDESRSPMGIRPETKPQCKVAVTGQVWTGKSSMKGGELRIRDLSGTRLLAVSGVLRFHFPGGRYFDRMWRHQTIGNPLQNARLTPEDAAFGAGVTNPLRVEGIVLGAYFGDQSLCGETGNSTRQRYLDSLESARKDASEALGIANALPAGLFEETVRAGLLKAGPYARETTASSNALLRATLIGPNGKLIANYKQWLQNWVDSLKSAK